MAKLNRSALVERLGRVRLLSLDVDGVLTDGGLYYADDGSQLRKFNVKDGKGIKLAMKAGVAVAIVSAGTTPAIRLRAEGLGITHIRMGREDKLPALDEIRAAEGLDWDQVAHVGDDLNDLPAMEASGLGLAVADAVPEVLAAADWVTERPGGRAAVREICDLIVNGA